MGGQRGEGGEGGEYGLATGGWEGKKEREGGDMD